MLCTYFSLISNHWALTQDRKKKNKKGTSSGYCCTLNLGHVILCCSHSVGPLSLGACEGLQTWKSHSAWEAAGLQFTLFPQITVRHAAKTVPSRRMEGVWDLPMQMCFPAISLKRRLKEKSSSTAEHNDAPWGFSLTRVPQGQIAKEEGKQTAWKESKSHSQVKR